MTVAGRSTAETAGTTNDAPPGSSQWVVAIGWTLSAVVTLVAIVTAIVDSSFLSTLLVTLTLCLSLTGALRSCLYGFRPAAFVFYGFMFSWLGVGPAVQLSTGLAAWDDKYVFVDVDKVNYALALGVAFIAAVLLGESWGRRMRPSLGSVQVRVAGWLLGGLAAALAGLAWLAISVQGGPSVLFSSRAGRRQALELSGIDIGSVGGIGPALTIILPAALSTVLMHLVIRAIRDDRLRAPSSKGPRILHLMVGAIAGAGLVLFANPVSNSRFVSAICLGSVALALAQPRTRRAGRIVGIVGGLAMLVFYPLARWVGANSISYSPGLTRITPEMLYVSPDFDGFQQVINSLEFVDQQGLSGGRYTLSALFFFLPRSLWEGKSRPAALDVAEESGYWFTNLSLPIHAELYLDFGLLGVLAGGVIIGAIAGRADEAWLADDRSTMSLLAPVIALTMLGVLRGPMGSLAPTYLTIILILVAAMRLSRCGSDGPSRNAVGASGIRGPSRSRRGTRACDGGFIPPREPSARGVFRRRGRS